MATRAASLANPDREGQYARQLGWNINGCGKRVQHKFRLGSDKSAAEVREALLRRQIKSVLADRVKLRFTERLLLPHLSSKTLHGLLAGLVVRGFTIHKATGFRLHRRVSGVVDAWMIRGQTAATGTRSRPLRAENICRRTLSTSPAASLNLFGSTISSRSKADVVASNRT
jgi:hypothetical protein